MTLFQVKETRPSARKIDARHPFGLPGVHCDTCGLHWAKTGVQYPTVDGAPFQDRLGSPHPIPLSEFTALVDHVRSVLGRDVFLPPGTMFGAVQGTVYRRPSDVEWVAPWTLLLSSKALARLEPYGIVLRNAATSLRQRDGTACRKDLREVELEPAAGVCRNSDAHGDCKACGYTNVTWPDQIAIHQSTIPAGLHLFRGRDLPALILASEEFAAAARALRLPNLAFVQVELQ